MFLCIIVHHDLVHCHPDDILPIFTGICNGMPFSCCQNRGISSKDTRRHQCFSSYQTTQESEVSIILIFGMGSDSIIEEKLILRLSMQCMHDACSFTSEWVSASYENSSYNIVTQPNGNVRIVVFSTNFGLSSKFKQYLNVLIFAQFELNFRLNMLPDSATDCFITSLIDHM